MCRRQKLYTTEFTVASILAIWKLGLYYVIIDKRTPKIRLEFLLNRINSKFIIGDDFIGELNSLNKIFNKSVDKDNYINSEDIALICFTSGSTAEPKGVMIGYDQLCIASENISIELINKYLTNAHILTLIPNFSTLAANIITFGLIFSKGYLHIIPDDKIIDLIYLIGCMKENQIIGSIFPPQLAEKFLECADGLLQAFVVSTDKASHLYSSKTTIINLHGLTETISFNTFFIIDKAYKNTPIGKLRNNTEIYLLDDNLKEIKK